MSTKLINFSIFGSNQTYWKGAVKNAALYQDLLPDYTCRFYVPDGTPERFSHVVGRYGAEIVQVSGYKTDWTATMWRFWALRDTDVSHFLFRDADSRGTPREVRAVRDWEDSGKGFHVMRDHPAHHAAMLAGMWGCTQEAASKIRGKLPTSMRPSSEYAEHYDQSWLHDAVWPVAASDNLTHAQYWTQYFGPSVAFSEGLKGVSFVGRGVDGDDNPRYPDHDDLETLCRRCQCSPLGCERRK